MSDIYSYNEPRHVPEWLDQEYLANALHEMCDELDNNQTFFTLVHSAYISGDFEFLGRLVAESVNMSFDCWGARDE